MNIGASNLPGFFHDAVITMKERPATAALTSLTLAFALAITAFFIIVFTNINSALGSIGSNAGIIVYVKDEFAKADPKRMSDDIRAIAEVRDSRYISKEAALKELKEGVKGYGNAFEGIDPSALPAAFEVTLKHERLEPEKVEAAADVLRRLPWAEDVQFSREWVRRFATLLNLVELIGVVVGAFLAAASVFIVTNTVRLTLYARIPDIEVMRLVGASEWFIKAPFFIEGAIEGAAGGLVSFGMLVLARDVVSASAPDYLAFAFGYPIHEAAVFALLVLSGMAMAGIGSLIATARFLKDA